MTNLEKWIWQQKGWPEYIYDKQKLDNLESQFLLSAGEFLGSIRHINDDDRNELTVELISDEAYKTSEIEGEILDRDSLQSSIKRNFGLSTDNRKIPPAERGIAEMLTDLYLNFAEPLSHDTLFRWHEMVCSGRRDLENIGQYRTHEAPMQVVSGANYMRTVHYEAPPSKNMSEEMKRFIDWFNNTSTGGETPLPALTRASLAHLYFVLIHPFEDGNGRIGRAIAEKALSQCLERPTLIALSRTIQDERKAYFDSLERNNKRLEITLWMTYFSQTILDAQARSMELIKFLISKTRFFDQYNEVLNARQKKVIARLFKEGPSGFKGGLSAKNYNTIAKTSSSTATRDLKDLVDKGILKQTGEKKSTRYWLIQQHEYMQPMEAKHV